MAAKIIAIADAVVTELNSTTFGPTFRAARKYIPVLKLEEMEKLYVTVVPKSLNHANIGRNSNQRDYEIDVAVQKRVSNPEEIPRLTDELMALTEAIANHFPRLVLNTNAVVVGVANVPVYSPEHLEQLRQFTSVITLTFRVLTHG